ncbi:CS domain-containing protein [Besnoitia besnoiti]|uniref:CS domain-containing protein n=1 Tax=Besnoitia besnoiti TaxID=94643 RepID=A0A2A9M8S0_BESBE|nr:CS domain-containing protein [Besnoitia besnoiti]PFH32027.1 CS domain-containing protein [Besnoitia besnoiti]
MEEDVKTAIERGWWKVAKEIILQSHKADADVTSTVRKSVADVRVHLDELIRVLNKQHHEIPVVPPAFQWAQSPIEVFLNIKFAYRWSSPGALSVTDPQFTSEARSFTFTGIGTHSGIQKKYSLSLGLFEDIVPEATKWSFASVGKVVVTLQKKKVGVWHRLTEDKAKISNMNVWWDMKEKVQKDLDDFHHGNYTVALSTDSTQTGEVNAEEQAEKATTDHDEEL